GQDPPLAILHELDEPVVAGLVDPAAGRLGHLLHAGAYGQPRLPRLPLGQAHRADLRVGERDAGHRVVLGGPSVPAQDVGDDDVRLVHGYVGECALAGDVTHR